MDGDGVDAAALADAITVRLSLGRSAGDVGAGMGETGSRLRALRDRRFQCPHDVGRLASRKPPAYGGRGRSGCK